MYCRKCKKDIFGGSICHLCGGTLLESEKITQVAPSKAPLKIVTRKKYKVAKEFGQTLPGRVGRLLIEAAIFCAAFIFVSIAVVKTANWLSTEMVLEEGKADFIDIHSRWMKYFWYVGCTVIVFLTVKFRFKPGK